VVLDDCHDATAPIVARHPSVQPVTSTARNVGAARRLGTERALQHVATPKTSWLANTDADSRVPPDWLTGMIRQANQGADVILGTVRPGDGLHPQVEDAWFAAHDLGEGHSHVHGANLGIRASTYLHLGGWRPLVTGEDTDLADRAARSAGVQILRNAITPVVTSTRGQGRAPHGFSSYLRKLRETNPPNIPAPRTPSAVPAQSVAYIPSGGLVPGYNAPVAPAEPAPEQAKKKLG
jgi:Glycosyl transferase family 2